MNNWLLIGWLSSGLGLVCLLFAIAGTVKAQRFMPMLGRLPFVLNHGFLVVDKDKQVFGGGDRWTNAVITIVVPIAPSFDADDEAKSEALGKEMELIWDSLDDSYAQTIAMSGRWEIVEEGEPIK